MPKGLVLPYGGEVCFALSILSTLVKESIVSQQEKEKVAAKKARTRNQRMTKGYMGKKYPYTIVQQDLTIASLPATTTGWAGKDLRLRANLGWLTAAWQRREIVTEMRQRGFREVAFDKNR